jgi:hydroxymethylpyrimidine pyrophosphatase-like HAD family hydrolase
MRYTALACDFDGTIADNGRVRDEVISSLEDVSRSGRELILVTGRMLDELLDLFPQVGMFSRVVAEDGGVLFNPRTETVQTLAEAPPTSMIAELQSMNVNPLYIGRVILATWRPNESAAMDAVRRTGYEHQIIFNKDAVMIVPPGVNKASGLRIASQELGFSLRNTVGVGNAQNDYAFLRECEFAVAVGDAVDVIKESADWVTQGNAGDGVIELASDLVENDLCSREDGQRRSGVRLGVRHDGSAIRFVPNRQNVLVSGPSGAGKSHAILGIVERALSHGYQICICRS